MGTTLTADGENKEYRGDMTVADLKRELGIPDSDNVVIDGDIAYDRDRLEHYEDGAEVSHAPPGGMDGG